MGASEEKQIGDPVVEKAASAEELCAEAAAHESHRWRRLEGKRRCWCLRKEEKVAGRRSLGEECGAWIWCSREEELSRRRKGQVLWWRQQVIGSRRGDPVEEGEEVALRRRCSALRVASEEAEGRGGEKAGGGLRRKEGSLRRKEALRSGSSRREKGVREEKKNRRSGGEKVLGVGRKRMKVC